MNTNVALSEAREGEIVAQLMEALRNEDQDCRIEALEEFGGCDLAISVKGKPYGVVIKQTQLRSDVALGHLSQAVLEAQRHLSGHIAKPFALLVVPELKPKQLEHIDAYAKKYIPEASIAVLAENGQCWLRLEDELSYFAVNKQAMKNSSFASTRRVNLFSDTNQWLLKVLMGEYLPDSALSVPRNPYLPFPTAASLAKGAGVSTMTTGRFVNELNREGFLDTSKPYLSLMRLEELLERWRAASVSVSKRELPMRFLFDGDKEKMISKLMDRIKVETCLGLFDAARHHELGFVGGAVTYLYVPKLTEIDMLNPAWSALDFSTNEKADIVIRQAPWPTSIFKASINSFGTRYTDVIQTWLDVSSHPTRGAEQADFIWKQYLQPKLGLEQ